ncbi:MAG: phosphopantetheine-binding protein [Caulobacteraceae bacterium]
MQNEINNKVKEILLSNIETDDKADIIRIDDNTDLSQIGISSIDYIKVLVEIEDEFGIEFNDDALNGEYFKTLGELVKYVCMLKGI